MPAPKITKIVGRLLPRLVHGFRIANARDHWSFALPGNMYTGSEAVLQPATCLLARLDKVARPLKLHQTQAEDIRWLLSLFQSDGLHNMSMARLAGAVPPHDCINMDALDLGVCGV
jgi:hypothetical protein